MNDLKEFIIQKRPNISKTSINTYYSILKNLHKKVFEDDEIKIDNFNKSKDILKYLKDLKPNKRKTVLSALVVITDNKDYRNQMLDDIKDYNKDIQKQEKTPEQEENWVDKEELIELYKNLFENAKIIYKKKSLTPSDFQDIQNFIILSLLGGFFIPPRRAKDFVNFKIKNINKEEDNYLEKNNLVFNSYKTAKTYGQQIVEIPAPLKSILNKWIKVNPTDYLLFDVGFNQLSNVKLNQRLNKMFGKKIAINGLRHYYLSDKYGDMIEKQNELTDDMKNMGSSRIQEKVYIKK
jgi:hypothetical protein